MNTKIVILTSLMICDWISSGRSNHVFGGSTSVADSPLTTCSGEVMVAVFEVEAALLILEELCLNGELLSCTHDQPDCSPEMIAAGRTRFRRKILWFRAGIAWLLGLWLTGGRRGCGDDAQPSVSSARHEW